MQSEQRVVATVFRGRLLHCLVQLIRIFKVLIQEFLIASDVVDVWWVLRLLVVENLDGTGTVGLTVLNHFISNFFMELNLYFGLNNK